MKFIGEKLRIARLLRGWSANKLSKESGITESEIVRYECEESVPDEDIVFKIACVLKFPKSFFTTPLQNELEVKNTFL